MKHFQWNRKAKILTGAFLAAAFLVLGGFIVQANHRLASYERYLNNSTQHAFAELTTAMAELDTTLQKASYASSPALLSSLCTELFGRAMSAQMAIGELPYGNLELEQTAAFVAKVGDYALALAKNAALNGAASEDERSNLRGLSAAATSLSQMLLELEEELQTGGATLEGLDAARERLSRATEGDGGEFLAGSSFQTVEADFPEVPSLIYDGPFSEHLSGRKAQMLADCPVVTREEARDAAAALLELKPEVFSAISATDGQIPTWDLTAAVDGGELSVSVTRQGGMIASMLNSRAMGEERIAAAEAVHLAQDFLAQHGWDDMRPTYHIQQGGRLMVNFAFQQNGVLCYPDLIKVTVALDNGRIVGLETEGYLMNHTQRELAEPAVTLAQAQLVLDPSLKLLGHQLTLIPTGGEHEVLCYEFKCQLEDGRHYLLYVNAQTGDEEKILILLEDESGTLTI